MGRNLLGSCRHCRGGLRSNFDMTASASCAEPANVTGHDSIRLSGKPKSSTAMPKESHSTFAASLREGTRTA